MKKLVAAFLFSFIAFTSFAQRDRAALNWAKFDYRKYHFGFALSGNQSSFFINYKPDFSFQDSLLSITNVPQAGFNLHILASYNPIPNVNVRFLPGLSFQDRSLQYQFLRPHNKIETQTKPISSVWLEFPVLFKFRTNRTGNFAAYALVGGKYARDMQSQKNVSNNQSSEIVVKLKSNDYCVEAGGGMDFFLPFFKFAVEFKTSIGIPDLLIHEDTKYAIPIDKLRSRAFVVSITFEG
jgi:hypothetical protein